MFEKWRSLYTDADLCPDCANTLGGECLLVLNLQEDVVTASILSHFNFYSKSFDCSFRL